LKKIILYVVGGILAIGVIGGIIGAISNSDDATPSDSSVTEEEIESGADDKEDVIEKTEPELGNEPVRDPLVEETEEVEEVKSDPTPIPTLIETSPTVKIPSDNSLLTQLTALTIAQENALAPYDRDKFPHWDDEDGDGMDTRKEVLAEEKIENVGWYSRWDGIWYEGDGALRAPSFDIDHIVALSEAWDSGASEWGAYDRDIFADDRLNLVAVSASSNRSKGGRDAGEWLPSEPLGKCFLSMRVIQVKSKWELTIDQAEYDVLKNLVTDCGSEIPPIPNPPPSTPTPIPNIPTPTPIPPNSYGSSYYITANGVDIDQYDSNGNNDINCGELPSSAKPVTVINPGVDPYDLDRDSDGVGCE